MVAAVSAVVGGPDLFFVAWCRRSVMDVISIVPVVIFILARACLLPSSGCEYGDPLWLCTQPSAGPWYLFRAVRWEVTDFLLW